MTQRVYTLNTSNDGDQSFAPKISKRSSKESLSPVTPWEQKLDQQGKHKLMYKKLKRQSHKMLPNEVYNQKTYVKRVESDQFKQWISQKNRTKQSFPRYLDKR